MQVIRPGSLVIFNIQGPVSNQDRQTSMRLFAQEVMPAVREFAKELDLPDALERAPGQSLLAAGAKWAPVSDRGPLKELGLH
jgi:hypothetical protein